MNAVMMRAVGGPDVLETVELQKPAAGPGQVLIRAMAIGVGMVDVLIRTGKYKWMPPLPTSPGSDLAGIVEAAGTGTIDPRIAVRLPLSSAADAHRMIEAGGGLGKIILVP